MARDDAPPFARGETWTNDFSGVTALNEWNSVTPGLSALGPGGVGLEGKEYTFEPNSALQESGYWPGGLSDPNGRPIRVKVLRNRSTIALKPGRVVHYDETGTYELETGTDGYAFQLSDRPAGVVDEYLPAAGVPPYDLFYVVIEGPTTLTNGGTPATILRGSYLVPAAGTGRTNDDSGRVTLQDLTGVAAVLADNLLCQVGHSRDANSAANGTFRAVVRMVAHD